MIGGTILARRYAQALVGLGSETGQTERYLRELGEVTSLASQSDDLSRVLFTPLYPREERRGLVRALAERLELARETRAFLLLLVDENRTGLLQSIRDALQELVDRQAGRVEATVRSARPLSETQQARLREALSRRVNAEVSLTTEVDPTLIGGVVARVGDLLFDGSVKTQLASLADSLRKGAV